jgi:hypothetical protein
LLSFEQAASGRVAKIITAILNKVFDVCICTSADCRSW